MNEDQLLQNLEEAMTIGVVEEMTQEFGRYRFNHALTQQTLTEELSMTRRARLHARIAEVMEAIYGEDADLHAIELVEHFANAEIVLGTERLIRYLQLAGEQSLARYANDQAFAYFQSGLDAKGRDSSDDEAADLYFGLAQAQVATLEEGAVESLRRAFEIYEKVGNHEKMVEVAVSIHVGFYMPQSRIDWIELACERCLALVPERSHPAAHLLATLPAIRMWRDGDYDRACQTFQEAIELARENDDPVAEQRAYSYWSRAAWSALKNEEAREKGERHFNWQRISEIFAEK